ncbi:MAG: sulfite exporter TauE/SafE family protein [Acidobacteriaceae bacterium]
MNATMLYVVVALSIAAFLRSAFGFGEALFAVPVLALRIPLKIAAPLAVLVSITIAAIVVVQDWRHVQVRSATRLVVATLFGLPLGLFLLKSADQRWIKAALAVLILAFAVYSLLGRRPLASNSENKIWAWICGFCAGVLGGAYGMNGPPLVIYGAMRGWSPQQFRATLQGYFLPASILGMCGYALTGMWTPAVTHYYLFSLSGVLPAIFLGRVVNLKLNSQSFLRYVYVGLAAIGFLLLAQSLHR